MANLIGLERVKLDLGGASAPDERTIDALIGAASDWVQKHCRRDFHARAYDELYHGTGDRRLLLREYALLKVQSVRYRPVTVLKVQNTDTATNQQARVTITKDGLELERVASGTRSVDASVTFSACPTPTAAAGAINALGSDWQAQVQGDGTDYGKWPSVDLYVPQSYGTGLSSQGALTARGQFAELKMHTYELAGYQWDPRGWLLRAIPYTDPELVHPEDLVWPAGINNFRVQYVAGYPQVPDAVQEATGQLVSHVGRATCLRTAQAQRCTAHTAGASGSRPSSPRGRQGPDGRSR
jgi:hypothetical protein